MYELSQEAVYCGRADVRPEVRAGQVMVNRELESFRVQLRSEVDVDMHAVRDRVMLFPSLSKTFVAGPSFRSSSVGWNPYGPV